MFIGSTDVRGLHHLVYEIVDNSVDEALAGHCDRIAITIHQDGRVSVADNGRASPWTPTPTHNVSALELIMTTLHAGASSAAGATRSRGLARVGASVVNALSRWCRVEVRKDGKLYVQEYERGVPRGPVHVAGESSEHGTTVIFHADDGVFESLDYEYATLAQRFREMAYLNAGLQFAFIDERQAGEPREVNFYFEGASPPS